MKFLIAAIVGGVIGYFTNFIAIKMLFRPYEEKYIFGIKIPFTPGLIPKEQDRIARSVGQTVEEYLLSPEAIIDSFQERELGLMVQDELARRMEDWEKDGLKLAQLLSSLDLDREGLIESLSLIVIEKLSSEELGLKIRSIVQDLLEDGRSYELLDESLEGLLDKFLDSEELDEKIGEVIGFKIDGFKSSKQELREILPDELEDYIANYLDENQRIITYKLREFIGRGDIRASLESSISRLVNENVSGLITSFISVDSITGKIYEIIEDYLKTDQANQALNNLLKTFLEKFLDSRSSDLADFIFGNMDLLGLSEILASSMREGLDRQGIRAYIIDEVKGLDPDRLLDKLENGMERIISSPRFKLELEGLIDGMISSILDKSLIEVLSSLNLDQESIYDIMETIFKTYIEDNLAEILARFEISSIIESTIKEFDYEFAEKLILDIADKELKAITNLGAFLGAFLGLLSPLLQML